MSAVGRYISLHVTYTRETGTVGNEGTPLHATGERGIVGNGGTPLHATGERGTVGNGGTPLHATGERGTVGPQVREVVSAMGRHP